MDSTELEKGYSWAQRFEKLVIIYLITYVAAMQMTPWGFVTEPFLFKPITKFLAGLIGIEITGSGSGSGDTTYDYCKFVTLIIIALLIWFVLQLLSKNISIEKLRKYSFTIARYFLIYFLLIYGFSKVFPLQFRDGLSYYSLAKTFGETSPMGLLWNFMAHSRPFTFFVGVAEVSAGIFLIFRRTSLIGSLLSCAVMFNVFLLNMCFDVPVKLFSAHLLFFSLYLLYFYKVRIYKFLLTSESIPEMASYGIHWSKEAEKVILILKRIFVFILVSLIIGSPLGLGDFISSNKKENFELEGLHNIINFEGYRKNKLLDGKKWLKVIFRNNIGMNILFDDETKEYLTVNIDTSENTIDDGSDGLLHYNINEDTIQINGMWKGDSLSIRSIIKLKEDFLLNSRGFHWINESPFNR
ncbi:MAG: hypothetical protein HKN51_11555 [Saprospiraceae bacterium]|nr:hypothetical protein [Bacteroidia bacterium]NNE15606.1 hypothetical protein [Saprospiraceae bacterium]